MNGFWRLNEARVSDEGLVNKDRRFTERRLKINWKIRWTSLEYLLNKDRSFQNEEWKFNQWIYKNWWTLTESWMNKNWRSGEWELKSRDGINENWKLNEWRREKHTHTITNTNLSALQRYV